ncbi:UNVERIFIED_CONTAM: hypothetical protein FKN15_003907 [Acipenser sinensis]
MAPDPVATRWNTWFAPVQYHANHFQYYHGFVEEEIGVCGKLAPHSLQELERMLSDETQCLVLKMTLRFINEMCKPIIDLMDPFESQRPCILFAFEKMEELLFFFETHTQFSEESTQRFRRAEDVNTVTTDQSSKLVHLFRSAVDSSAEKLKKYISDTESGQPAIKFLKCVRIFSPRRVPVMSHVKGDYASIPGFNAIPEEEFAFYTGKWHPTRSSALNSQGELTSPCSGQQHPTDSRI